MSDYPDFNVFGKPKMFNSYRDHFRGERYVCPHTITDIDPIIVNKVGELFPLINIFQKCDDSICRTFKRHV
jgi:hypothetical protein